MRGITCGAAGGGGRGREGEGTILLFVEAPVEISLSFVLLRVTFRLPHGAGGKTAANFLELT